MGKAESEDAPVSLDVHSGTAKPVTCRAGLNCSCDGFAHFVVHETIGHGCCGNFLSTGECCGNAIPVPEIDEEYQGPCPNEKANRAAGFLPYSEQPKSASFDNDDVPF